MATTEFGRTVRRWRDRLSPTSAGRPARGPRHAAGLRREDLALLAGVSVGYVTRLEQGRAARPSPQVVEALARALRLPPEERACPYRRAGPVPPGPDPVPSYIPPSVHRLLDRLAGTPVAVFDAAWTLPLANQPYAAPMGDPSDRRGHERNSVWRAFAGPRGRARQSPSQRRAFEEALVADLRHTVGRYPADRRLRRLVEDPCAHSERLAEPWESGSVGRHEVARKTIDHPRGGAAGPGLRRARGGGQRPAAMVCSAEPGTPDAERPALVTVLGTQSLVDRRRGRGRTRRGVSGGRRRQPGSLRRPRPPEHHPGRRPARPDPTGAPG